MAEAPSFVKHPKYGVPPYLDHLYHTNVPYTHELVVCSFLDGTPFHAVTAFVFAVMSASVYIENKNAHHWTKWRRTLSYNIASPTRGRHSKHRVQSGENAL